MWYERELSVRADQAIFAESEDGRYTFVLLPHIDKKASTSYRHAGYDWFNIKTGGWNSCMYYSTVAEAIRGYKSTYRIFNANLCYTNKTR
jgi:hypothetical protein